MGSARKQCNGKFLLLLKNSFLFSLFIFASSVGAKSWDSSDLAGDNGISHAPQYSILYDQLLILEQQGKYIEALRLIPKIYAAEDIPVDAFYLTLDNKKQQLLDEVVRKNLSFYIGREESTCQGSLRLFTDRYIGKPESYKFLVPGTDDLEFERDCYLLFIEGHRQKTPWKGSLLLPSNSKFKFHSALNSADPWLVSAALFFARKQEKPTVSAQAVIERWERRPDLWDDSCTQQALLFLALFDAKTVKKLQVSNEDIKIQLEELQAVPSDKSYLSPLLFSSIDGRKFSYIKSKGIKLVKLEKNKQKRGVIKRWGGDKNQFSNLEPVSETVITAEDYKNGVISVAPGFYKIRFNSVKGVPPSGYYGKSSIVEVKQGEVIVIPVPLIPAI